MLKRLSIAVLFALGASSGQAAEFLLTDSQQGLDVGDWKITSDKLGIKSPAPFSSRRNGCMAGVRRGWTC
ncbi:hypothetical protein ACTG2R_01995 [Aeromonas hydrophila]|uniref:hypothetical protein n=1 Tax=Aeromonas hydrophila TaxID=644 RepID=UPI003F78C651